MARAVIFPLKGFVLDPSKCCKLSMDEKREIVYEISKWSHGAPEMLQSWSRRELLQILCAEMGKERKYTGLPKIKMIEHLLKIVSEKKLEKQPDAKDSETQPSQANTRGSVKRQRKTDNPSRLAIGTNHLQCSNGDEGLDNVIYCPNSACRATIRPEDAFCKRCSCCICFQYDDNKDPSLWLVCDSEPPHQGISCGMSCHLECAIKNDKTGISKAGHNVHLDGSFFCICCGKVNDLLRCLRKQLIVAKEARRVDVLCYRIFLSHKLLRGTEKYRKLLEIVDIAMKKLEAEVGALDGLPIKMARGIVNRLSSGAEIQKLCSSAIEILDSLISCASQVASDCNMQEANSLSPSMISSIDVSSTSLTVVLSSESVLSEELVGFSLWHRKAYSPDYPAEPTSTSLGPNRRFFVSNLTPATDYVFKIISSGKTRELGRCEVSFSTSSINEDVTKSLAAGGLKEPQCRRLKTNCSGLSNPSSEGDESNSSGNCSSYCEKTSAPDSGKVSEYTRKEIFYSEIADTGPCCQKDTMEQEEMLGDSVSTLDEERATGEVASGPNSTIPTESQRDSTNSTNENQVSNMPKLEKKNQSGAPLLEEMSIDNESNAPNRNRNEMEIIPYRCSESARPITPSKLDLVNDGLARGGRMKSNSGDPLEKRPLKPEEPQAGSSSKKRSAARCEDACNGDGSLERDYEYCVKVIRWLECEGHIQKSFRVKFLTWFSLRATPQERRIVSVYVDTLIDDPASLAGQLIDTFSEGISSKRSPPVLSGFCMKLWH